MVRSVNPVGTAKHDVKLVGVVRSLTDIVYATYLSYLAVHINYQQKGIGKELIWQTKLAAPHAAVILLSAPAAINYYPKIGMEHRQHAFWLKEIEKLI